MHTRVTKRGQVCIPQDVRRQLGIKAETVLEWVVEGDTVRVIPIPEDPVKAFRGSSRGTSVASLLRERRRSRQRPNG